MKLRKNKKGFTIVELVIVIGVIGILSAILIPTFVNLTDNANKAAAKQEVSDAYSLYLQDALDGYIGDYAEMTTEQKAAAVKLPNRTQEQVVIKRATDYFKFTVANGWENKGTSYEGLTTNFDEVSGVLYNNCTVYTSKAA